MLVKNEFPILEYDDNKNAVLMPNRTAEYKFPTKAVFAFLGGELDKYAVKSNCEKIDEFESVTKNYPIWKTLYNGENVLLCEAPCGAAPATQILDYLIGHGCTKIISAGSCGDLVGHAENTFLVPYEALRDEGTSYHYRAASRTILADERVLSVIEQALNESGYKIKRCKTWTTDGFFRETAELVEYRKSEGCEVVEMECSALMACAQFRDVKFGQMLFTADTLCDPDGHDARSWGTNSFIPAIEICLKAVNLL